MSILLEKEDVPRQSAARLNNLLGSLAKCVVDSNGDIGVLGYVKSELDLASELLADMPKEELSEAEKLQKYMQQIRDAIDTK